MLMKYDIPEGQAEILPNKLGFNKIRDNSYCRI